MPATLAGQAAPATLAGQAAPATLAGQAAPATLAGQAAQSASCHSARLCIASGHRPSMNALVYLRVKEILAIAQDHPFSLIKESFRMFSLRYLIFRWFTSLPQNCFVLYSCILVFSFILVRRVTVR